MQPGFPGASGYNVISLFQRLARRLAPKTLAPHLRLGQTGEGVAKRHLKAQGLKFLTANFRTKRGEIDLVFRDRDCLVFVEVKSRSSEEWGRPADAIDKERRQRLTRAGLDYLRLLRNPPVKVRFDVVEVLFENGRLHEVRHLCNAFPMERPYRYD